jgi:hypothetical protein
MGIVSSRKLIAAAIPNKNVVLSIEVSGKGHRQIVARAELLGLGVEEYLRQVIADDLTKEDPAFSPRKVAEAMGESNALIAAWFQSVSEQLLKLEEIASNSPQGRTNGSSGRRRFRRMH